MDSVQHRTTKTRRRTRRGSRGRTQRDARVIQGTRESGELLNATLDALHWARSDQEESPGGLAETMRRIVDDDGDDTLEARSQLEGILTSLRRRGELDTLQRIQRLTD